MKVTGQKRATDSTGSKQLSIKAVRAVDLFCGVGGLTHGMRKAGIDVVAGFDVDPDCRYPYTANNSALFIHRDIRELRGNELKQYFDYDCYSLLAGCAPCQPFSKYSRSTRAESVDKKWDLLLEFGRLIDELEPDFVTMENVPQLLDHSVFEKFLDHLSSYWIWYDMVECASRGIPQTRTRLVMLASKHGPIELSAQAREKVVTVRDVLASLPALAAGEADSKDPLHASCSLSAINLKRIRASCPGGTWRDWPSGLRAKCHNRESGKTYPSVYGRMEWDSPAPTITTQCFGFGNGRFGHPEQDRAISLREAAIIQTFPKRYKFLEKGQRVRFNVLGRLIGNAVPVELAKIIAKSFIRHTQEIAATE